MSEKSDLGKQLRRLKYIIEATGGTPPEKPDSIPKFEATNVEFVRLNGEVQLTINKIKSNMNRKQRLELRDLQHAELPHLTETIAQSFESAQQYLTEMGKILDTIDERSKKGKAKGLLNFEKAVQMIEFQKRIIAGHQKMIDQLNAESKKFNKNAKPKGRNQMMQAMIGQSFVNFEDLSQQEQDEELKILEEWKQKDSEMDGQLSIINDLLLELKETVKQMDLEIEKRDALVINTKGRAVDVRTEIENQNKDLTDIRKKMRGSGKCCVDIMLILLLIFLTGVVIKLAT